MLERYFGLKSHGTTVRTELIAGLTTFLTIAYIVVVMATSAFQNMRRERLAERRRQNNGVAPAKPQAAERM